MKKIKVKIACLMLLLPGLVSASEPDPNFYSKFAMNIIGIIGAIVVFAAVASLIRFLQMAIRLRELQIYEEQGIEPYLEAKTANKISWWKKLSKVLGGAVPVAQEADILLNHDYDGIQELDNRLPPWWLYGFYFTIFISFVYVGIYHFSDHAKSSAELYDIEIEQSEEAVDRYLAKQANRVDESNVELLTDMATLNEGKNIFDAYCVACHGATGGGSPTSVGPNLTDEYWLHGGGIKNVFKTVKYGVPAKGMIAWKDQLRPSDIHKVSSYILSLQGSNPPGAKKPQGEPYVAEATTLDTLNNTNNIN